MFEQCESIEKIHTKTKTTDIIDDEVLQTDAHLTAYFPGQPG